MWDTEGSPERARWLHLARSGSQSHRAIWFILLAHRAGHIIANEPAEQRRSAGEAAENSAARRMLYAEKFSNDL